jgi:branched-chain amino acid transport system substrate-binding protein
MRHRRWALVACGAALLSVGAGSCTTAATSTVSGPLRIYVSDPAGLTAAQQDVVEAEQLAFTQRKSELSGLPVELQVVRNARISDDARAAIDDSNTIAYLGEVVPGSSADSVGITNAQDVLQVSPTDTASALTRRSAVISGSPQHYYESFSTYGQTFARVVPSSAHEAAALLSTMHSLGVRSLAVETDPHCSTSSSSSMPSACDYGRVLANEIATSESGQGITDASSATGADAVLFAGSSTTSAASALNSAATSNPHVKLFVSSALADPAFVATLSPAAQSALYASVPAPSAPEGTFASDFRSAYGHTPSPQAIFGYAAMQVVLDALRTAGSKANARSTVVGDVVKHSFSDTPLGQISIDRYGDSSLSTFRIDRVKAGQLVPGKLVQG